jgi:hypothetical protein
MHVHPAPANAGDPVRIDSLSAAPTSALPSPARNLSLVYRILF